MKVELQLGERPFTLEVTETEQGHQVTVEDPTFQGEVSSIAPGLFQVRFGDDHRRAWVAPGDSGQIHVEIDGESFTFARAERKRRGGSAGAAGADESVAEIRPPMPGRVVKMKVAEGDVVEQDQVVAIVEAMKMELELATPIPGKVTKVTAADGELIDTAQPLVVVEREEAEE